MSKTKQKFSESAPRNNEKYVPALGYHWLTPYYDWVVGLAGRGDVFMDALILQAQLDSHQQVLDLACGTGSLSIRIKQTFPVINITALDCDPEILQQAEQKVDRAGVIMKFDQAFAQNLPYSDESFDRVVSSLLFHHLTWAQKKQVAREVFRVLKPQGELHVLDWGRASNWLMRGLFLPVQMVDGFKNTQENVSGRLIGLFEQAGFNQVSQQQSFNTIFGTLALYRITKD